MCFAEDTLSQPALKRKPTRPHAFLGPVLTHTHLPFFTLPLCAGRTHLAPFRPLSPRASRLKMGITPKSATFMGGSCGQMAAPKEKHEFSGTQLSARPNRDDLRNGPRIPFGFSYTCKRGYLHKDTAPTAGTCIYAPPERKSDIKRNMLRRFMESTRDSTCRTIVISYKVAGVLH